MKKILKSKLFSFLLFAVIFTSIGVAASTLLASNVEYSPQDSSWKKENGENIENVQDAIDELYLINKTKSDIITGVSFNVLEENTSLTITPVIEISDNSKFFGYHAFAVDEEDNIYHNMSTTSSVTISGLTSNKKYNVYVLAYDSYNMFAKSRRYDYKTSATLEKKTYSASNGSYPYVLTSGVEKTLITYGDCNLKLKKMYIKLLAGNSGAISSSTINAYVYGYKDGAWELIKNFSASRGVRVSSATVVNTTVDLSSNEKVYTNFKVTARSNDHEIYASAEFQPTGVIID